jgi:hypothetical protein
MAKFILSVGDGTYKILESEAQRRDVTVQQLLRAVIVPEWVRENLEVSQSQMQSRLNTPSLATREIAPHLMHQSIYPSQRDQLLQAPVNRLRT